MAHTRRGLLVGRFQPFHKGHEYVINQILEENEEAIIAIGSAQLSYTLDNPLTAGERVYMIRSALKNSGIGLERVITITVPDIQYNSAWPAHLKSYAPPFNTAYTNNPLVTALLKDAGISVKHPKLYMRDKCSGTNIRRWLLKGDPEWQKYVPVATLEILSELKIRERLLRITAQYENPEGAE
ncbi:MAG: nicotinamide-nucleotide adenylyltransferase [Thermoprotei archaeon]